MGDDLVGEYSTNIPVEIESIEDTNWFGTSPMIHGFGMKEQKTIAMGCTSRDTASDGPVEFLADHFFNDQTRNMSLSGSQINQTCRVCFLELLLSSSENQPWLAVHRWRLWIA